MSDRPSDDREAALGLLVAVARRETAAATLRDAAPTRGGAQPALATVVRTATVLLEAAAASIALHDPVTDRLVFVVADGPAAGDVVGLTIEPGAGIGGYAYSTGQPLAIADVAADPRFDRSVAEATGYVPRSLLATPLIDADGTVGVLEVLDRRGGTFDLRDLEIGGALAATATAIVRADRGRGDVLAVLREALGSILGADPPAETQIDAILATVAERVARDADDPVWRLADRLGRLVATDAERLELAVAWVDALLDDEARRHGPGRR